MECQIRVDDVFCAVSLSGTMPERSRFVVLRGTPSVSAILLMLMPCAAILSVATSSSADRTIIGI